MQPRVVLHTVIPALKRPGKQGDELISVQDNLGNTGKYPVSNELHTYKK